jgi:hypothetical protein
MLSAVLLHVIESTLPVNLQTGLNALLDGGSGMVNMACAHTLDILDLDALVDGAVIAWLSASLREQDYSPQKGAIETNWLGYAE